MPLRRLALPVLALPRVAKRLIVLALDSLLCVFSVLVAFFLRLGEWIPLAGDGYWQPWLAVLVSLLLALPVFITHGFYRAIFRYTGWSALMTVARASMLYGILYAGVLVLAGLPGVPRTIGIIQPMLLLLLVGGSRAVARFWLGGLYHSQLRQASLPRVLIYGAGSAGRQLAAALANSHEMRVVAFLDDDRKLQGHVMNGLPIHAPALLPELVLAESISTVLLALPSASRKRRNEILAQMLGAHVSVRTLPSVAELSQGKIGVSDLRELDIDDLLGREPVVPDPELLARNIRGKVVLVTGAGGSIGSELCRQILQAGPASLLLVEQSEFALYAIHQELQAEQGRAPTVELIPLLASVQDAARMHGIMAAWRPHTVYHAAAYKHVPLVEHNPVEGVRNNVFGTLVAARAARDCGVADFVLISTDKAVRPTNIMGASKRLAELVLQALAAQEGGGTRYAMVRFGNVLGSSGSVVPKFRQQIRDGGPITLTHPEITRYFMTIPEAAQLVIQAGAMGQGGDVFVLDMGQPVRIIDLALRMIELSGLEVRDEAHPDGDIAIEITGLRPGEKLYEELLIGDNPLPTRHPRIMKAHEDFLPWVILQQQFETLDQVLQGNDVEGLRGLLQRLVAGYVPNDEIVDWLHLATASDAAPAG